MNVLPARSMRLLEVRLLLAATFVLCSVSSAQADDREDRARAFWVDGTNQYELGRFEEAIRQFERAYELDPSAPILFNLAQAHSQQGRYKRARFYFLAYLRQVPDAENALQVRARVKELDKLISKKETVTEAVEQKNTERAESQANELVSTSAPTTTEQSIPRWYADKWGWAATGAGLVAIGMGTSYLVATKRLRDDIAGALTDADRKRLREDADSRQSVGTFFLAGGAVMLTAGVILLAVNPRPRDQRLQVSVSSRHLYFGLRGRF